MKTIYFSLSPFEMRLAKAMIFFAALILSTFSQAQYQVEKLNRGIVAVRSGSNNFVSWRWLGTEDDITFNLYRNGTKVNASPLTVTNYTDNGAATTSQYYVRAIIGGVEQPASETVGVWGQNYLQIPLQIPAGGTTPDNVAYTYTASDCSVGDVDGDGIYEILVKWEPTNAKDNSQSGYTGNVFIDCYKLNGTRLWRIDLGRNIRAGAHYTQFMVYDFDGDGKAEMACKTADATKDAAGTVIGNSGADHRNSGGYVLAGPEYLTMFNGETGRIMQTVGYIPARGTVSSWGDNYGNRVDRFLAGVAYLDGKKPSLISCRGYYTRTVVVAWDWVNGAFVRKWTFDSNVSGSQYTGQGDHSLSIGDVDGDNKQEVVYGAMVIDDNGAVLYSTGNGHGDALHVSDFDPTIPGLEVFNIQERDDSEDCYLYSPGQKRVIWKKGTTGGEGPGRGVAANITEQFAGAECWIAGGQVSGAPFQVNGSSGPTQPSSVNFLAWWDGDLARELCNGTTIDKYPSTRLLTASGCASNNGTKSTPGLVGDILGDWREELVVRSSNNDFLRIYTTNTTSPHKVRTLVHDAHYRVALAWQNTAYNQPPHPSFYLGDGVALPPKPNITVVGGNTPVNQGPTVSITAPADNASYTAPANITINATAADVDGTVSNVGFYNGSTLLGSDATSPYSFNWTNVSAGTYTITARATDNSGAVTTSSPIIIKVTLPGTTIQAETACTADGILSEATNAGFNGSGYLNLNNAVGSAASWVINSTVNQSITLNVRYANGSANNRNMSLSINSTTQHANVDFLATGAWTTWNLVAVSVNLVAGRNVLSLVSLTAEGAPNIDELNYSATSVSAASCTAPNQAPTISITAPVNNATFTAPASITINATATDTDGTVSNVEFYNGSTLLGSDASSSYSFNWTNVAAGTYTITAKATDNEGTATTSSAITIVVNPANEAPTISIAAPANNATFTAPANITINAIAADADGAVSNVEFYDGATLLGSDASSPYSFSWINVVAGTYTLTARATDNSGAVTTSSPVTLTVTTPPSGTTIQAETACTSDGILSETVNTGFNGSGYLNLNNAVGSAATWAINSTVNQSVTLSVRYANGSVNNRNMSLSINGTSQHANVDFLTTGAWTTWNIAAISINLVAGRNVLSIASLTDEGAPNIDELTFSATSVSVASCTPPNQVPTVSITSPANNATFTAPANITINATAADADGTVSNVEFYNGTALLGSDAASPYTFSWANIAAGTYTLTAKATDNAGAVTTSSEITIVVDPANQFPTVSITSPANNATFTAPANIAINATAADADGTVSNVEFYNGTALLGSDAASPYSFSWANVAAGTYTLTVKATDNAGAVTISEAITIVVNPANQFPTVSITSPANNSAFIAPANITINATAADADGTINSVEFYNGTTLLGSDASSPYSFIWTNVAAGTYILTAKATDNSGAITTSSGITVVVSPMGHPPVINITSPANNSTFVAPANITIQASAMDADGVLMQVQFYNGSTLLGSDATTPYSFNWANVPAGTYTVIAKATDNEGKATTSTGVTITVTANQPTVITITSPLNNSTITGNTVTIDGTVNDPDGDITSIECYNGTTLIGSNNVSPFSFDWNNVGEGTHVITIKATDSHGEVTSQNVTITVNNSTTGIMTGNRHAKFTQVYPNPSREIFMVKSDQEIKRLWIVNMYGIQLEEQFDLPSGKTIEVGQDLPEGTYILMVEYISDRVEVAKIVKVK